MKYSYYKTYKKGGVIGYCWYSIKTFCHDITHTIYSIYLCLRFPFLYPRNRFTNKHYTNWDIMNKKKDIYCKWSDYSKLHMDEYYNRFGWDAFFKKEFTDDSDYVFDNNFILSDYIMKLASKKDKFLCWFYGFYHNVLEIIHCIPTYNELDAMPYGWRKKFGIAFCKDLKKVILKDEGWKFLIKDFRIEQIKEKYGVFTFYSNYYTKHMMDVIDYYENISSFICIDCGDFATKRTLGYICPYCDKCYLNGHQNNIFEYINPRTDEQHKHNEEIVEIIEKY